MAGFAHMATEDDEYDGYFIPKGHRSCMVRFSLTGIEKLCIG